ncbi:MAG: hypothetical protein ACR2OZ_17720 [Verrucomicrobiales bacterium]
MKRIAWFLILVIVAFLAWKYYPLIEKRARERTSTRLIPQAEQPPESRGKPAEPAAPPIPARQALPQSSAVPSPVETFASDIEQRYPMPEFKPLEVVVGNWRAVPPTAFPRQVAVKVPVSLRLPGGTARVDPGAEVVALSIQEDLLTVAPAIDSPARGQVPVHETDFKEVLTEVYEKFKEIKRQEVVAMRRQAQTARTKPPVSSVSSLPELLDPPGEEPPRAVLARIGPRPAQNTDRTVPAMTASINERQLTAARGKRASEPRLAEITSWGRVRYREMEGEPYWVGSVRYTARTIFGEFPAEALALMRHGKVIKWVYAGTNEPVF